MQGKPNLSAADVALSLLSTGLRLALSDIWSPYPTAAVAKLKEADGDRGRE